MSHLLLKMHKEYKVPNKHIHWNVTKYSLVLSAYLKSTYQEIENIFPPIELGRCETWRVNRSVDDKIFHFTASWDLRRINDKIHLLDSINEKLSLYAID